MPRKRGLYGTSPPSVRHRYAMEWAQALEGFLKRHGQKVKPKEGYVMTDYPWENLSVPGLWSWRGAIWAKYEGRYPDPSAVGLDANHWFFDKDYVCLGVTRDYAQNVLSVTWHHHGRRLTERSRLWKTRPMP